MIFISHSSNEDSVTNQICEYLESHDIKCWMDHRDAKPGELWEESIVTAIKNSKIMLIIFSKNANNSKHMGKELTIAAKSDIDIIPFKIEDVQPNKKFEYYLTDIHWHDAIKKPIELHLTSLLVNINTFLSNFDNQNDLNSIANIMNPKLPLKLKLTRKRLETILKQFMDDSDYLKLYFKRILLSDLSMEEKNLWGSITGQIIKDWSISKKNEWDSFKKNLEITVRYIMALSEISNCLQFFRDMFS